MTLTSPWRDPSNLLSPKGRGFHLLPTFARSPKDFIDQDRLPDAAGVGQQGGQLRRRRIAWRRSLFGRCGDDCSGQRTDCMVELGLKLHVELLILSDNPLA